MKVRGISVFCACLLIVFSGLVYASTPREIEASCDASMDRFYKEIRGAKEFVEAAKGILILPKVIKGGFFVGGEYGEGALRIGGKTVDYYSIASGSFGLQFGGQMKDIILIFMQQKALDDFRKSKGWEVGLDGSVVMIDIGAGGSINSTTVKDPIVGFVFGQKGLMVDVSLKGAKLTKLDKSK